MRKILSLQFYSYFYFYINRQKISTISFLGLFFRVLGWCLGWHRTSDTILTVCFRPDFLHLLLWSKCHTHLLRLCRSVEAWSKVCLCECRCNIFGLCRTQIMFGFDILSEPTSAESHPFFFLWHCFHGTVGAERTLSVQVHWHRQATNNKSSRRGRTHMWNKNKGSPQPEG